MQIWWENIWFIYAFGRFNNQLNRLSPSATKKIREVCAHSKQILSYLVSITVKSLEVHHKYRKRIMQLDTKFKEALFYDETRAFGDEDKE